MKERAMKQKQRIQRHYPDPDLYMPAMPPLGLINAFERRVQKWWRQRVERRQAAALRRSRPSGQH
ncbi:MAG: hypothetical protein ACJATD_000924 [Alloalcanivorax sp.]|jgi:hypothetical protein